MYDKRVNLICKQIISRNEENEVMSILIKNGHVIDPDSRLDEICDVLIENGRIAKVEKEISDSAAKVIDAAGCYLRSDRRRSRHAGCQRCKMLIISITEEYGSRTFHTAAHTRGQRYF